MMNQEPEEQNVEENIEDVQNDENEALMSNKNNELPKSPKSPRSILKKTISERSVQGKTVYIFKNAHPINDQPLRYRIISFEGLLSESMHLLSLPSQAKKVFTEDGKQVKSFDEIADKQNLYISCGEKFNAGLSQPKKFVPPYQAINSALTQASESNANEEVSPKKAKAASPRKTPPTTPPKKPRRDAEVDSFHRTLMESQYSVDEALRDSTASVYASLGENQKRRLPNREYLQALHDESQQSKFIIHLFERSICPSSRSSLVNDQVNRYAIDILKGLETNELKFVIGGPRQSGKTSFLYTFITQINKKLQLSEDASKFLFFPINFEFISHELNHPKNLFRIFVNTAIEGAHYSDYRLIPYIQPLKQYFHTVINSNVPQFPANLKNAQFIDIEEIKRIGQKFVAALHANDVKSLTEFISELVKFPNEIALALGFDGPFYVFDSFEYCDRLIHPNQYCFPASTKPISLAEPLSAQLNGAHYVVSYQEEQRFMECFACNDAALIDIQGAVRNINELNLPNISIFQPKLHFTPQDCHGCPGYLVHYSKLVESIRRHGYNATRQCPYAPIQSVGDNSRMYWIKQDLKRLCKDLLNFSNPQITAKLLNTLDDTYMIIKEYLPNTDASTVVSEDPNNENQNNFNE